MLCHLLLQMVGHWHRAPCHRTPLHYLSYLLRIHLVHTRNTYWHASHVLVLSLLLHHPLVLRLLQLLEPNLLHLLLHGLVVGD